MVRRVNDGQMFSNEIDSAMRFIRAGKNSEAAELLRRISGNHPSGGTDGNCDVSEGPPDVVRAVLLARPRILKDVPEDEWLALQVAAAMRYLHPERRSREWLPPNLRGPSNLEVAFAVEMIVSAGQSTVFLEQVRRSPVCKLVRVLADESSCPECRALSERAFPVDAAPELPCINCSSELGCRCCFVAELEPRDESLADYGAIARKLGVSPEQAEALLNELASAAADNAGRRLAAMNDVLKANGVHAKFTVDEDGKLQVEISRGQGESC